MMAGDGNNYKWIQVLARTQKGVTQIRGLQAIPNRRREKGQKQRKNASVL